MICYSKAPIVIPRGIPQFHARQRRISVKSTRFGPEYPLVLGRRRRAGMDITSMSSSSLSPSPLLLTSGASGRVNALCSLRVWRSLMMLINAFVLLLLVPFRRAPSSRKDEKREESGGSHRHQRKVVRVPARMVSWRKSSAVVEQEVAARRALATRRVVQDGHGDGGGDDDEKKRRSVREYSLFVTARGDTIFTQSWTPVSVNTRGLVLIMHGLNEHSGRYDDFARQLNANGYKVYGMDWIGHGGSDGLHAYVHSLDDAVADMKSFLEKILAEENPGLPCFCFGHSTGAAIVLKAMLDPKVEARVAGAVVTSPAVGVQPTHPIFVVLAPIISFLFPRYQLSAANKKGVPVSRDPEALITKYSDPLVYTGSIRVRTGYEILRITSYLQQNLSKLRVPFLVLHGIADTVTDPKASQKLHDEASSTDKTIRLLEGFLHDLLFELEREIIVNDIIEWLNCRV
ncbi:hypothetical protein FH972_020654 [Carpinus fangiana]|uniref:Serine aminopeptidase S33 domain-containing protein n=1 Tax=Carpinus fangiana TaxID=176857 RepID=A0A5N6RTV5_9ROSI|nr:hypothetical protein FH972_020654 [Carpinus fangiana]